MASTSAQTNMIDKLRSLFLLLDPSVSSLSEAETEERNELMKRLEYFEICCKKQADYYRLRHQQGTKYNFSTILSRFLQLIRECVLSHQWPEALNLIQSLCYEVTGVDCAIWKVGLACLFQDCEKNGRLVEQFVKQVCVLRSLTVVEVLLDYLLFILTQAQTADAMQLIKDLKENTQYANNLKNKKRMMAHTLFFAYQGLACYAEWKLAIFKVSQDNDDVRMNLGKNTDTAKAVAESALEYLSTVKDVPGVWDIFITRLVEIHEYYGKVETARSILVSYRERNPGNPNAHRYLYEFESRSGGDEFVLLQCLQDIIHLDPCNPLCLTLYHLKEKNDPGAVALLFDYIDYTHCSQNEQVWQVLADKLNNANSNNLEDVLKLCWETRRDWWPNVVFKDLDLDVSATGVCQPGTLLWNKRIVRDVLLHLGNCWLLSGYTDCMLMLLFEG
ncbi:unnamed protein product [Candidula unifasciata]|uniref:TATA box-binding protein-associated factor RNA polymerase I subunit A n=1 Tax=Candidula unifasciata TaxID=100452 RepID=A0A8S3Z1L8_9EUPU|nr:unnamed protein product [Candidula unifasciata]